MLLASLLHQLGQLVHVEQLSSLVGVRGWGSYLNFLRADRGVILFQLKLLRYRQPVGMHFFN